ncbi:MAG: hypothetical protein WBG70_06620 [Spirulinaceae cyanobacterium]
MRLSKRLIGIFYAILACVVCVVLVVLSGQNAWTQTKGIPIPELKSEIPHNPPPLTKKEEAFGAFAWQTFVALNWPADCKTGSSKDIKIGQAHEEPRVWEFYNFPESVFHSNLEKSVPLENPSQCHPNQSIAVPVRYTEPADDPDFQFRRLALIDQSGNYILNEIHLNPTEVNQIVAQGWNSPNNLVNFNDQDNKFALVCSDNNEGKEGFPCETKDDVGAIEIKAAWRVLPDLKEQEVKDDQYYSLCGSSKVANEYKDKYYITCRTFEVEDLQKQKKELTVPVGLVGFHIMQKTSDQGWIFSTFEHIDNVRDESNQNSTKYTLFDPNCQGDYCKPNYPFAKKPYLWSDQSPYGFTEGEKAQIHSQIIREVPITKVAKELNEKWKQELKGSIWQYYQLIGTQWLEEFDVPNTHNIEPTTGTDFSKLANVTLEPYIQKTKLGMSCMKCHINAQLPNNASADFSFLLNEHD